MDPSTSCSGRILLVGPLDDASCLEPVLCANSWEFDHCTTPAGVLRRLRFESPIDLVILVPESSLEPCVDLCRSIKLDARTAFISVVFALPPHHTDRSADTYEARADDCIQLPATYKEIQLRLSHALRIKRATDVLEDSAAVLTSLAGAIEGRDAYTHGHVERVSAYCVEIGKRVGVDAGQLVALKFGGIVHDIGKVAIPDAILNKPAKLTNVEMELVKSHPIIGWNILKPSRTFGDVMPLVRWHHERPNGKGYPDGLKGEQLPLLPRIVAVTDVFDALSTPRPYRPALSPAKVREVLSTAAENEDLDPSLVAVLFDILGETEDAFAATPVPSIAT